jgi:putative DNA methylase
LSKKKGKEAHIVPTVVADPEAHSGQRVFYSVVHDEASAGAGGTMSGRQGAVCVACSAAVTMDYIKSEGVAGRIGAALTAVVAEGHRRRIYLAPTPEHERAARVDAALPGPSQTLGHDPRNLWTPQYGLSTFSDLFTPRQLMAMTTFTELVSEAREQVLADAIASGLPRSPRLRDDGQGADAYADAVAVYLALAVSRLADWSNSLCSWESSGEVSQHLFTGQKIGMAWDFSEANVLGRGNSGSFQACVDAIADPLSRRGLGAPVKVEPVDARRVSYAGAVINTDPPYYDNIDYGDLSDFYYVWHRMALGGILPELYGTIAVPKDDEIVAHPYRAGGAEAADSLFERAFYDVFSNVHRVQDPAYPVVVYYASKQSERVRRGEISSSWSSVLEGLIRARWQITATWPVRSENVSRAVAQGANSMASSIVLALRAREAAAVNTDRRGFIATLEAELPRALRELQSSAIAPIDLQQAAVGSGIAVFSRYSRVVEPDGSTMTVRSALERINETVDAVLNEQEGDFDTVTRFAVAWYRERGYGVGPFGEADNVARARNTSVDFMDRSGILTSRAGIVQLSKPADLAWDYDPLGDAHTSNWEALHHLIKTLERDGIAPAGDFLGAAMLRPDRAVDAGLVKELAHLLFRIAEGNQWPRDALSFNNLVTSWPDVFEVARENGAKRRSQPDQGAFDFDEDE